MGKISGGKIKINFFMILCEILFCVLRKMLKMMWLEWASCSLEIVLEGEFLFLKRNLLIL